MSTLTRQTPPLNPGEENPSKRNLFHKPQHSRRTGNLAITPLVTSKQAPRHRHEADARGNRLQDIARRGAQLLGRHLLGKGGVARPETSKPPVAPKSVHAQRVMGRAEVATKRTEIAMLNGNDFVPTAHKPLMDREAVLEVYGVNAGELLAKAYSSVSSEALLCFDESTYDKEGYKTPKFRIATAKQLQAIRRSYEAGDQEGARKGWAQTIELNESKENKRRVVSGHYGMPGTAVDPHRMLRGFDGGDAITDKTLLGGIEFWLSKSDAAGAPGDLRIADLDNPDGTIVEYNPALVPGQDPWLDSDKGMIDEPLWRDRQTVLGHPHRDDLHRAAHH